MSGNAFVYIETQSNPPLWTVGHYEPNGKWHANSDHSVESEARAKVGELNGEPKARNHDLLDLEVAEALATLRRKYPEDRVEVWVQLDPDKPARFTTKVSDIHERSTEFARGNDLHATVEDLIHKAGERNPVTRKQARIEALRKELAELEGVRV